MATTKPPTSKSVNEIKHSNIKPGANNHNKGCY